MPSASGRPPEQRGHGGHHDGAEAQQAGLVNRVERRFAFLALGFERKVDHHDGVFLDDADQQDDADQGDDAEFRAAQQQAPESRRRPRKAAWKES